MSPPLQYGVGGVCVSHGAESEVEDAVDIHRPFRMFALVVDVYVGYLRCQQHAVLLECLKNGVKG